MPPPRQETIYHANLIANEIDLAYPTVTWTKAFAKTVRSLYNEFTAEPFDGHTITALKLVLATGIRDLLLSIPG